MRSVVKKTRLNSWKDDFLMKSFPSSTKRKLSILWIFLFPFLSFNGVFLTLKCRTFVLKHLHGDRAATILLKMDICHYGFQIWKREYSRALDASYTFQPLMSFWRNLIYTLENPLWAWPFFRRWNKVSTPYLRARWTFRRTRRVFIFLKIRQQNNAKYSFHYTFKNKVGASKRH